MPNWCHTDYIVQGPAEEIHRLYQLLKELAEKPWEDESNDFGPSWLGNLAEALRPGILTENPAFGCRGDFTLPSLHSDNELYFATSTAWVESVDVNKLLDRSFPDLKFWYIAEEFGTGHWVTNDPDGDIFPERFYLWAVSVNDGGEDHYLYSWEEVADVIGNIPGEIRPADLEECRKQIGRLRQVMPLSYHELKVVAS